MASLSDVTNGYSPAQSIARIVQSVAYLEKYQYRGNPLLVTTKDLNNFTGNITVLWVLLRYIKLRTMTDVCLLNLAVSDLMQATTLPLWTCNDTNLASCKLMTGGYQVGLHPFFLKDTFICISIR